MKRLSKIVMLVVVGMSLTSIKGTVVMATEVTNTVEDLEYKIEDTGVVTIQSMRMESVSKGITRIVIPEEIEGKTVTSIDQGAFNSFLDGAIKYTYLELPDTVKTIGAYAFANNAFTEVKGVSKEGIVIGLYAFERNKGEIVYTQRELEEPEESVKDETDKTFIEILKEILKSLQSLAKTISENNRSKD